MSITSARTFIEKSGCGLAVGIVLALVMIVGIFQGNCSRNGNQDANANKGPEITIATIGESKVSLNRLREVAEPQVQQQLSSEVGLDPVEEATLYGNIAQALVSQAILSEMAREKNVTITDDDIRKANAAKMEDDLMQAKMQLIMNKQLKPDASEADFNEAVKKATGGQSLEDLKAAGTAEVEKKLQDPNERQGLAYALTSQKVTEAFKSDIKFTDAELKKGFDTYTTKRIIANFDKGTEQEQMARIEKAIADIKGGMSFEAAMNKYTDDPVPSQGKPKSESTVDLQYSILSFDVTLSPILKLKVGEISPILRTSSGPAIYKLYKIQNKVPADFEKQKETLRKSRIDQQASRVVYDEMRKRLNDVKYESTVLKALVDWRVAESDPDVRSDKAKYTAKLKELYESVKNSTDTLMDPRIVTLSTYGLFKAYYDQLPAAQQASLDEERLEVLKSATDAAPHVESLLELSKLAIAKKDKENTYESLKGAIEVTAGSSDLAVQRHKDESILVSRASAAGLIDAEQKKELQDTLKNWETNLKDEIDLAAESNADYSEVGEMELKSQLDKVNRFEKAGYFSAQDAKDLRVKLRKWTLGVFEDIKLSIESNTDYSETGQSTFAAINSRIDRSVKAAYITAAQAAELQKLQNKWKVEKKKFDDEEAKAKKAAATTPKPGTPPTPGSNNLVGPGATTGR